MEKNTDLFGNEIKKKTYKSATEKELINYDKALFLERLERLKFVKKHNPKGYSMFGDMEFVFTFSEIQQCYVNGHFIATVVLSQSFLEKLLDIHLSKKGLEKVTKYGLEKMIKVAVKENILHPKVLELLNNLRLKRNPFIHSKDWDYPHTLSKRSFENRLRPEEQLEKDATEAMSLLYTIFKYPLD